MFATEARPTAEDAFARKVIGKVRATDYPAVVLTRNGEHVPVEVSSVRVERAGHVAGIFGVFEPETDRTLTETCAQLTPRQSQVLRLLAQGASTDQIAASLGVTRETVRNHVRDILRRLNAHSRLEAVLTARKLELV